MTDAFPGKTTEIEKLLKKNNNNLEKTYEAIIKNNKPKNNKPNEGSDLSQLMGFRDDDEYDYDFDTLFQLYELTGSIEGMKEWMS